MITEEPWDCYHLESLLPLKETYRENTEFGFLLRHYWIPATILQFRQSSQTTYADGKVDWLELEIERKMARCRSNEWVYNEAPSIDALLQRVLAAPYSKQVIIVDDASTDGTVAALQRWEGHPCVELLAHGRNRGKGAAIRTALEAARGRITIIQDADLEYDPQDYPLLIEPLLAGKAQVVYGSRYLGVTADAANALTPCPPEGREERFSAELRTARWTLFRCGVAAINLVVRLLYGTWLTDEATCYKAFPTDAIRKMDLVCQRFEFCPEVTAKALRMGLRILEVPIHYDARSFQAGKKIRWTDGLAAIATLWKWRKWRPMGQVCKASEDTLAIYPTMHRVAANGK